MSFRRASDTLLAFDTSTEQMAVAVATGDLAVTENLPGGAAASAGLLPCIDRLFARIGSHVRRLSGVAFGSGPGAFTGLRTSCAVAQGLALGAGCPVLPIDSLLIVAEQARTALPTEDASRCDIGVVMDARMGEVYAARYVWVQGAWQTPEMPELLDPAMLAGRWSRAGPMWHAGSGLDLAGGLAVACPSARRIDAGVDRAGALLGLARQAWNAGREVDAAQALPTYLRDKVALTTAERAAGRLSRT